MRKITLTVCVKCNSVKKCGEFARLTFHEIQIINTHLSSFTIEEDICDQCLHGIRLINPKKGGGS